MFVSVFGYSSWGMLSERQWHDPKGPEPGMPRFISLPFNRVKYPSSRGLHPLSFPVCESVCVSICKRLCVCVFAQLCMCMSVPKSCVLSAQQGYAFWLCYYEDTYPCWLPVSPPIQQPPTPATTQPPNPPPHVHSHWCCGRFRVPSFPAADCRGGSGCRASLMLTSWDSPGLTGRGLLDRAQSATPPAPSSADKHTYAQINKRVL